MIKNILSKICAFLLIGSIIACGFCSCSSQSSFAGLVSSVKPTSMLGNFISTKTEFNISTARPTDSSTLQKALAIYHTVA